MNVEFVLDSDVFIRAHRGYYPFDLAPGFWSGLESNAANGKLRSIDKVYDELQKGSDALSRWAEEKFKKYFLSTAHTEIAASYGKVMNWVMSNQQFQDFGKTEFASGADGWLVALGMVSGCRVITEEVFNAEIKRKVPLPNVCRQFGVQSENTFWLMRNLNLNISNGR
jgi:hypothetical protein